jgi:hypothetical protein
MRIFTWPSRLPEALGGLFESVASGQAQLVPIDHLRNLALARGEALRSDAVLVAPDGAVTSGDCTVGEAIAEIAALASFPHLNIVVVIGDGYLGADITDLSAPIIGAAALAVVRSIAVTRGFTTRANVVCVPAGLIGEPGSQRGPLPRPVDLIDIVEATRFLLDEASSYINGQILFVNGGRQLFSSLSA